MKFSRSKKRECNIDLIPLINVIFLMLIFFMVSGTIDQMDFFKINIPESETKNVEVNSVNKIFISGNGKIAINNSLVSKEDFDLLIRTILLDDPKQVITVKVDNMLPAKEFASLLEDMRKSGAVNLIVATEVSTK